MAKALKFGNYIYPTKVAATKAVQYLINKYEFNEILNTEDKLFFLELFKLHTEYKEKIGCGIDTIEVRKAENGCRHLYLKRVDGSGVDISWRHCISPKPQKATINEALRSVVKNQIQEFKEIELSKGLTCPYYGIELNNANCHVDHYDPTFETLVTEFQTMIGHKLSYTDLKEQPGNDYRGTIKDSSLLNNWSMFHLKKAKLRLISKRANLSDTKKKRSNDN